jgi:hypothetical protein
LAKFPFVYNYSTGRAYYGNALPGKQNNPEIWTNEEQKPKTSNYEALKNAGLTAGVIGAFGASGFIKTKTGNCCPGARYS